MKKYFSNLVPLTTALLCATAAVAQSNDDTNAPASSRTNYLWLSAHTNHLSLSLRYGLGISAKFKGIGGSLQPGAPAANGRRTREGDAFNYDDGYVLTDVSGNFGNQTWYWGYDHASQVSGNNIAMSRTTAPGLPSSASADSESNPGVELSWDRQLGEKEDWHHLRYGVEGAANYLPISVKLNTRFSGTLSRQTDTYGFTPGTTPPSAPYDGSFGGPGFVIDSNPNSSTITSIPGATFLERDRFDANLFGFRLGPYAELPLSERLSLRVSGGLAVGLLASSASWHETLTIPGEGTTVLKGHRDSFNVLWGGYVAADATWQINRRWSIDGGVQFQDLGKFSERLGLRKVELDLSHSLFVLVGIGYNF